MKDLIFYKSTRKNKKYDVYEIIKGEEKYLTSFGDSRYSHYFDKIGEYEHLNHLDKKRRDNYYKRHKTNYNKYSSDWFSKKLLW
tara:strand:- start:1275 stop:1526 length:252 start_codon:yes stop_codon:yes gene_type:complete